MDLEVFYCGIYNVVYQQHGFRVYNLDKKVNNRSVTFVSLALIAV
jgi:hypothetical protein